MLNLLRNTYLRKYTFDVCAPLTLRYQYFRNKYQCVFHSRVSQYGLCNSFFFLVPTAYQCDYTTASKQKMIDN